MLEIFKRSREKKDYIKVSPRGQLYVETKDFFAQPKVQKDIEKLLNSRLVKDIKERKIKKIPRN